MSRLLGNAELGAASRLLARAPHLDHPVEIDPSELERLARFSETLWSEALADPCIDRLVSFGLLVVRDGTDRLAERELKVRQSCWDASALSHYRESLWHDKDFDEPATRRWQDIRDLVDAFGPPPGPEAARACLALPMPAPLPMLSHLVGRRRTARNFIESASLSQSELAALLWAAGGELGREPMAPGTDAVRRPVPSGGALHPIELWVFTQRVQGLDPGLYRYLSAEASLEPSTPLGGLPCDFARKAVAGQAWFANAPVLIFICCHFHRHLHKYRQHPKALRVLHVEAGHVAQNIYLAAAELGLGSFITLAVNEVLIESALGLDGIRRGVLAVAGAGRNHDRGAVPELWP